MWWWIVPAVVAVVALLVLFWRPLRNKLRDAQFECARREFHRQRERLEAKFFELAAGSGLPRGLRWVDCEFCDDVSYARARRGGQLTAFVAVSISFEAIEGGGMEHVEAVGNIRAATSVFHFDRGRWYTRGRALFNLNPTEAIERYQDDFEMVSEEVARQA